MNQGRNLKSDAGLDGYTLIEVLVAMTILSVGLLAIGSMQIAAIQGNQSARKATEANDWATATMERLINAEWSASVLENGGHEDPENPRDQLYDISWTVENGPAVQTKRILVTVAYDDRGGQKTISLDFLKSNPNPAIP